MSRSSTRSNDSDEIRRCIEDAGDALLAARPAVEIAARAAFGVAALEILALDELPPDFDAPDKITAIRNEAERLGLIRKEARQ